MFFIGSKVASSRIVNHNVISGKGCNLFTGCTSDRCRSLTRPRGGHPFRGAH